MTACCPDRRDSEAATVGVSRYLADLAALCLEVARSPKLLPTFLRILQLVPRSLAELSRESRPAA